MVLTRDLVEYGDAEDGIEDYEWRSEPSRESGFRIECERNGGSDEVHDDLMDCKVRVSSQTG